MAMDCNGCSTYKMTHINSFMTLEEASQILNRSIKSLDERKAAVHHRVYISHVEEDVVHVACLTILQNNAIKQAAEYAALFTQAATKLTELYTEKEVENGIRNILKNIEWNALWEQLQQYFKDTHDRDIGERDVFNF